MKGFSPNGTTYHLHLSVRGALRDFTKRQLKGMFRFEDGRECTAHEAREHLYGCLAQGKEVLPFGPACDGFDFSGGGCPGHDTPLAEVLGQSQMAPEIPG
ncbi:MAG: hypothetical protein WBI95_23540 [Pseudomonas veronii]|uniref:Uncharacterized protein n=1 Tax=Pseudomonas veronii TaxID=76761 RepID=A0A7Y1AB59_PSEVE|nr:hypothetical protein [Pseudomonas veronii]NMY12538.1 hypothetical protein [Pseudomonas veronii]